MGWQQGKGIGAAAAAAANAAAAPSGGKAVSAASAPAAAAAAAAAAGGQGTRGLGAAEHGAVEDNDDIYTQVRDDPVSLLDNALVMRKKRCYKLQGIIQKLQR